jgi:hypothetical protein
MLRCVAMSQYVPGLRLGLKDQRFATNKNITINAMANLSTKSIEEYQRRFQKLQIR